MNHINSELHIHLVWLILSNEYNWNIYSWQGGIFRRSDAVGNDNQADDGYALTMLLKGLPM